MAQTKEVKSLFALALVAPGGTRAAPVAGGVSASLDVTGMSIGSTLSLRVKNGASAPGTPGRLAVQHSTDGGVTWFDIFSIAGTTTVDDEVTMSTVLPRGYKTLRALAYDHITNGVYFEAVVVSVTD